MHGSGAVISKLRPSASTFTSPTFLIPTHRPETIKLGIYSAIDTPIAPRSVQVDQLRTLFISALVSAASRHHERKSKTRLCAQERRYTKSLSEIISSKEKTLSRDTATCRTTLPRRKTREELLELVDFYETYEADDSRRGGESQKPLPESCPEDKSRRSHSREEWDVSQTESFNEFENLLYDDSSTPESIFTAYQELPGPRLIFLDEEHRRYLIKRLSVTEHKTSQRTLAYFAVLDDFRKIGLPIPIKAWNSAIHLGSITLHRVTNAEVEFALKTWKQMEHEAGIPGTDVTFNILFDVATKAGKFNLAEMILKEMDSRKLEFTRFTRVSQILYHGLKRDGGRVRQAYRDLVDAQELVDTTVLNCVITALMAAGEPDAAHSVFERMRAEDPEQEGEKYVPRSWTKQRELSSILQYMARHARLVAASSPDRDGQSRQRTILDGMQDMISIAPDIRTYNILLRHYCAMGHLKRVVDVLESMQESGLQPNGKVFRDLFMGFKIHGTEKFSAWSAPRLENVWKSLLRMLQEKSIVMDDHSTLLIIQALVAVKHVMGPSEAMKVYEALRSFWTGSEEFEAVFHRPDGKDSWDGGSYDIPIDSTE